MKKFLKKCWTHTNRTFQQHNSLVVAVPSMLRRHLNIEKGQRLEFFWHFSKPDLFIVKIKRK